MIFVRELDSVLVKYADSWNILPVIKLETLILESHQAMITFVHEQKGQPLASTSARGFDKAHKPPPLFEDEEDERDDYKEADEEDFYPFGNEIPPVEPPLQYEAVPSPPPPPPRKPYQPPYQPQQHGRSGDSRYNGQNFGGGQVNTVCSPAMSK